MPSELDPELYSEFLDEIQGYLPELRQGIDAARNPTEAPDALELAFRRAHTIKGSAAMLGWNTLSQLAKPLEDVFEKLRTARAILSPEIESSLVQAVALIQQYRDGQADESLDQSSWNPAAEHAQECLRNVLVCLETQGSHESVPSPFIDPLGSIRARLASLPDAAVDFNEIQRTLIDLRDLAESNARIALACRLDRLAMLIEIETCLIQYAYTDSGSLIEYCQSAVDQLLQCEQGDAPESESDWILQNSDERWGQYLDLLQNASTPANAPIEAMAAKPFEPVVNEPQQVDPHVLSRLIEALTARPSPNAPSNTQASDDDANDEATEGLREIFAEEAREHLQEITTLLPTLEQQPENMEIIQSIRRAAHTIKGSSATVGLHSITQLAHQMEDVLDQLFERRRTADPKIVRLLFASADALEDLINHEEVAPTIERISYEYAALLGRSSEGATPIPPPTTKADHPSDANRNATQLRVPIERLNDLIKLVGELIISRSAFQTRIHDLLAQVEELGASSNRLQQIATQLEHEAGKPSQSASRLPSRLFSPPLPGRKRLMETLGAQGFDDLEFDRYNDLQLLSRSLSELTGDLQTIGGDLGQTLGDLDVSMGRQGRMVREFHDGLMRLRMIPFSTLETRLRRTVRNTAQALGKPVALTFLGLEIELDKSVLEALADPLLHMLRNAVDHGIEPTDQRERAGKPSQGTIRLHAANEGNQVVLRVSDDGRGIDPSVLRRVAIRKGLCSDSEAARLSDTEALALIFRPGFSSADRVTEVSGRGVGMDVVRAQVERLKGNLKIDSQPGQGTTFTIRLPVKLAVLQALLVKVGENSFAIPLNAVRQIVRLDADQFNQIGEDFMISIEGNYYKFLQLSDILGLDPSAKGLKRMPIVLLDTGEETVALKVDALLGSREVVLKSLGTHLRGVPRILGATLMGDGRVVLVLNPAELAPDQPARREVRIPVQSRSGLRVEPSVSSGTILAVDDSPSIRKVVAAILQRAGWSVQTAKDGREALEILHQMGKQPDVVLTDIEMPRMDGFELLATLKAHPQHSTIPVVMATSRAGEKHVRKAYELGASDYLVKPFQEESLVATIQNALAPSPSAAV